MTTGTELTTFITGLNGDATIDPTLLTVLVQTAQVIIEEERPWGVLRKTNSSLSATTAGTWETAYSLSGITDFSRLDGGRIRLSDGNLIHIYKQVPFEERLDWKDVGGTFVFDENSSTIYLNGVVPFNGSLYIPYISTSTAVDPTSSSAVWTVFPSRFLPLLGFYAVGIYKGGVDYDSINRQMLPTNAATLQALKNAMEKWDNERQQSVIENNDPTGYGGFRSGAIDRYGDN